MSQKPGLTLGPILYLWQPSTWQDFYFRIADEADIDTVVLGEVVCSKRLHFHANLIEGVVTRLQAAGKSVRLASLALVVNGREIRATRELCAPDGVEIEANDLAAHYALRGRPHAIGPLVNVYNGPSALVLAAAGVKAICLPPELPIASIGAIAKAAPAIAFEVFGFGRVPLAISARCAHARLKGRTKDNCQFVCGEEPDGMPVDTLDKQSFLALNGVQTMSSTCHSALLDLPLLSETGIAALRLSPQCCDMVGVAAIFRDVITGRSDPSSGQRRLAGLYPGTDFANGFLHGEPGHQLVVARANVSA